MTHRPGGDRLPVVRTHWELTPPFRILAVEPTIAVWGYDHRDFESGRLTFAARMHPADHAAETARMARDLAADPPNAVSYSTFRFMLGDDTWVSVASIHVIEFDAGRPVAASTLLSADPRTVATVSAMRDNARRWREDSDRLAAILRFAHEPILLTDATGRPTWGNDAFTALGVGPGLLQGAPADGTNAELPGYAEARRAMTQAVADGRPFRHDLPLAVHGVVCWYSADGVTIRSSDGSVSGYLVTLFDITAQRAAQAALDAQEDRVRTLQKLEAIGRLAAGVAHDFGNLLQIIGGSLDLIDRRLTGDDPSVRHVRAARGAVQRAADLTQQLLLFGTSHRAIPRLVDARQRVRDLEPMLRRLLPDQILLHLTLPPYPLWLRIEPSDIERVVMNLVLNAREAISGPGEVWVSLARVILPDQLAQERGVTPGAFAEILVRDTGAGMTPHTLARVFEPFFTTKGSDGTGLGLAAVHGIARHAGGYAIAASAAAGPAGGAGSTIRVGLPESVSLADDDPEHVASPVESDGRRHGIILLVEDDPAVSLLLEEALTTTGLVVHRAQNLSAAMSRIRDTREPIDLLVTDVVMPGGHGPELVAQARAQRPDLKVLLMSGFADEMLARHRHELAEVPLLRKPFPPAAFVAAVQELLSRTPPR